MKLATAIFAATLSTMANAQTWDPILAGERSGMLVWFSTVCQGGLTPLGDVVIDGVAARADSMNYLDEFMIAAGMMIEDLNGRSNRDFECIRTEVDLAIIYSDLERMVRFQRRNSK